MKACCPCAKANKGKPNKTSLAIPGLMVRLCANQQARTLIRVGYDLDNDAGATGGPNTATSLTAQSELVNMAFRPHAQT